MGAQHLMGNSGYLAEVSATNALRVEGVAAGTPVIVAIGPNATEVELSGYAAAAAATATVTFAAVAGKLNRLCGFRIDGLGATAGSTILVTVTGLLGGTQEYTVIVPAGVAVGLTDPVRVEFVRPVPASAVNIAIAVSAASFGAGNTKAIVTAHGFYS